jgi:antitoxin CptB
MLNKEILKKKIIFRSTHRGTKELDLLLGTFVKKNIDNFNENDLNDLEALVNNDDETLLKWYYDDQSLNLVHVNKVSQMLKKFKM